MGVHPPSRGALTRRTLLRLATGVTAGLVVGEAAYGGLYERHHLGLTRADLRLPALPPALDGLRIGLITDTHYSAYTSLPFITRAVEMVQREAPDLIVLGGDYVTRQQKEYIPDAATPFAALRAPSGVFGVVGNHDDAVGIPRALRAAGVTLLRDARTRLDIRGEVVDLLGVDYWTRKMSERTSFVRGRAPFSILLAHNPTRFWEAAALKLPLVLSGHTHGGQVSLPIVGPVAAQRFPVAEGVRVEGDTTLFVSRGVGTVVLPCRLHCPPEVAVLTLRSTRA
ncbi:MAG TPA: metallophosphoesterase [Luteitalea sp.]|nr:metallophosphoesterase [Luteitalea sp.]